VDRIARLAMKVKKISPGVHPPVMQKGRPRDRSPQRNYRTNPSAIISSATASSISGQPIVPSRSRLPFSPLRDDKAVICVTQWLDRLSTTCEEIAAPDALAGALRRPRQADFGLGREPALPFYA
jgi:hypothetical protein